MKAMSNVQHVYFIGIGGIGMSAIARYFLQIGATVSGYDKTETPLTKQLQQQGAKIFFTEDVSRLPSNLDLVVYTPAIPKTHTELVYLQQSDVTVLKRAEVLGKIVNEGNCFAVAGSHGKSTTSAMLAHVFKESNKDCTAFLGAIATNYQSNFIAGTSENFVVEADEFDRSFLHIQPSATIITSIDSDHLDIYGDIEGVQNAFNKYVNNVRENGKVFIQEDVANTIQANNSIEIFTYSLSPTADFHAKNLRINHGEFWFDVVTPTQTVQNVHIEMGGRYNVENAVAVIALASSYGITLQECKSALASFAGLQRRFEFVTKHENFVFIDDYAHHPHEIRSFIEGVKELYPNKRITAVFQPHLYSRTKDYYQHFAQSLNQIDEVFIMDIYPAREEEIEGVSSQLIANEMIKPPTLISHETILQSFSSVKTDVFVTIGAGDISKWIPQLKTLFANNQNSKA